MEPNRNAEAEAISPVSGYRAPRVSERVSGNDDVDGDHLSYDIAITGGLMEKGKSVSASESLKHAYEDIGICGEITEGTGVPMGPKGQVCVWQRMEAMWMTTVMRQLVLITCWKLCVDEGTQGRHGRNFKNRKGLEVGRGMG